MHAFSMITDFRLKVFETVARRLNFTRAAEELFITQPAVTRHIKELERLLDARLFKREGRGIALTAEGVRLLVHSRRILKEYETLAEDTSSGRNTPVSGELSLGASSTMSQYVLPPLLALFNRHYPEIRIRLKSGNTEEIEQAVQDEAVRSASWKAPQGVRTCITCPSGRMKSFWRAVLMPPPRGKASPSRSSPMFP